MEEKHGEICKTITQLKSRLKTPLQEIEAIEEQLVPLYQQERKLHEKSVIVEGKRVFGEADSIEFSDGKKTIELEMNPKEPKLMDKLEKGLRVLNTMDVHDLDGRSIKFTM